MSSLWDIIPNELQTQIYLCSVEHRPNFIPCLEELLQRHHKKTFLPILEEAFEDMAYGFWRYLPGIELQICSNDMCESIIPEGNELWSSKTEHQCDCLGHCVCLVHCKDQCFCSSHCKSYMAWSDAYDERRSSRRLMKYLKEYNYDIACEEYYS